MSETETETPFSDSQNTWSTSFAMVVRIHGAFSTEQLRRALARVRGRHPSLLQRQIEEGNIQAFSMEDPPEFPLEVRADCVESDWSGVAAAELQRRFSPEGPLARFVLLRLEDDRSDLIGIFHHWVSEGMSGMYVMRDILRLLGDPHLDLAPLPMPTSMLDLLPAGVREDPRTRFRVWWELTSLRFSLFRNRLLRMEKARPVFLAQELALKREIHILPASLSVAQTDALLARCRAERTSVHAAICVAWLSALAETLEGPKSWVRTVSSPVNVRNRLSQPVPETSGSYLAIVETRVNCAPGRDFWQAAREFKQRLTRDSADHLLFVQELTIAKMETSFPREQLFEAFGLFFSKNHYDFSITNLGKADIPTEVGSLAVEAFYGPLVNSMEGERTVGVSTFAGRLTFLLAFRRSGTDPAWAAKLMERVIARLGNEVGW